MSDKKIIIDCDPGIDDAVALLLCLKRADVAGIVAVGGNTGLAYTSKNARYITEIAGRTDVPVYAGYDLPFCGSIVRAPEVHGFSGLGDVDVPEPTKQLEKQHGVDFLIESFMTRDDLSLIALGPLTNVAHAILKEPRLKERIPEILIMGGSAFCGNQTPAAEFNICADPEAAKIVFESGIPIRMAGLNYTRQNRMSEAEEQAIRDIGGPVAEFCGNIIAYARKNWGATELCDACAVAWYLDPAVCPSSVKVHVDVETKGEFTRGMTLCDWRNYMGDSPTVDIEHHFCRDIKEESVKNVEVAMELDKARFNQLVMETIAMYK